VLYGLSSYPFTTFVASTVVALVMRHLDTEDISSLAGLLQRSPMPAATMMLARVSLAGRFWLGLFPGAMLDLVSDTAKMLKL